MVSYLAIDDNIILNSIDPVKGYKYIGLLLFPTNDITDIIQRNVNKRMGNFAKFHAWLAVNELTPIEMKLLVLDSCVFGALLNSSESWGNVTYIEDRLRNAEMTALRAILGVKKGTTIDLILHELRRCSIVAKIRDRQFKFFEKLSGMSQDDAIVKLIMDMFSDGEMMKYYKTLHGKSGSQDMEEREQRIRTSQQSMCKYYSELGLISESQIYNSMLSDYYRVIISRWRLSNHRLNIEIGWYTKPITEREDRVCTMCMVLEDEHHVVFICPRYGCVRRKYEHLTTDGDISKFLNPEYANMVSTANFLYDIEARRRELKL